MGREEGRKRRATGNPAPRPYHIAKVNDMMRTFFLTSGIW
jgi:hypothetical protein